MELGFNLQIKQEIIDIESSAGSTEEAVNLAEVVESATFFARLQPCDETISVQPYAQQHEEESILCHPVVQRLPVYDITNIEGPFQFQVAHPRETALPSKGVAWTYSQELDELYVKMDVDCPFLVQTKGSPPAGTMVRATPYYLKPEDRNNVPRRCLHHSSRDHETNRGFHSPEYIIRSYDPGADYHTDEETGRMSTLLPFTPPERELGMNATAYVFRFMCRTSCTGGMNRRPIVVVFTLEYLGKCFGRQVRKVRVCACPGRDRNHDEGNRSHPNGLEQSAYEPSKDQSHGEILLNPSRLEHYGYDQTKRVNKRPSSTLETSRQKEAKQQRVYTINVTSRAIYNILNELVPILEKNLGNQVAEEGL